MSWFTADNEPFSLAYVATDMHRLVGLLAAMQAAYMHTCMLVMHAKCMLYMQLKLGK